MLSKEDNQLVTRIGADTPMGKLMREYWIPALLAEDLPETNGNPMRVRLLGENLIAYRDTSGRVGLLGDHCPHRGASLYFGRNEEDGLRCVYHGWKFDVSGACVDMPNEPPESNFKDKIHHTAYPTIDRNGIVWAYMGPRKVPPPLPEIGWALVPPSQRASIRYLRECNWLQGLEGDIDSSHVNFLHRVFNPQTAPAFFYKTPQDKEFLQYFRGKEAPVLSVADTETGVTYGARRPASAGRDYWRVTQFQFPFYTSIPGAEEMGSAKIWVPIDDEHTMIWEPHWSLTGEDLSPEERYGHVGRIPLTGFVPSTTGWIGRGRFAANKDNDYLIDRTIQKTVNFTGLDMSNPLQDGAVQESMGAIFDRSTEHLGSVDAMIIRVRRRLLETVQAHMETGNTPPGVDEPALYNRRGVQMVLRPGANWLNEAESRATRAVAR